MVEVGSQRLALGLMMGEVNASDDGRKEGRKDYQMDKPNPRVIPQRTTGKEGYHVESGGGGKSLCKKTNKKKVPEIIRIMQVFYFISICTIFSVWCISH